MRPTPPTPETIIATRKALRLTTADAAQSIGVVWTLWESWERGAPMPSHDWRAFCEKHNVPVDDQ